MSAPLRRVVFDTSTLVSAALMPASVPGAALATALARCDLCASVQTWLELQRVLQHRKVDRYLGLDARNGFAAMLRLHAHFFAVTPADEADVSPPCRDPADHEFLALARVCQADALVSSDDDLLVLNPWGALPVFTPAAFLSHMGA